MSIHVVGLAGGFLQLERLIFAAQEGGLHVAEAFTGLEGVMVDIKETIKGFNMIMDGELDHLPESAFNLVGSIEDAIAKGEKLLSEAE